MPHSKYLLALLSVQLFLAQGHAAPPELDRISGNATYRERIALPEDALLTVELLDVSKQDARAERLSRLALPTGGRLVPLAFELPYYPADVKSAHRYTVRATLTSGGQLLFTTAQHVPVLTHGAGQQVQLVLQQVQQQTSASLENTYWKLVELDMRSPAQALPGEREAHLLLLDGRASGSSGCNKLMGQYTLPASGILRLDSLTSSRMACPPAILAQEAVLIAAYGRTTRYRIAGETLTLLDGDTVLARFEARYFK